MGLFDPIWKTKNEKKIDKAIEAVQKITDQSKLIEIARTAPIGRVQHVAVWKISDPNVLCDIILSNDPAVSADARDAASSQLTETKYAFDQQYLLKIAQNSDRFGEKASEKITDQSLLRQLALGKTKNQKVRSDAVLNITDHKVLAEIAEHARPPEKYGRKAYI